MKPGKPLTPSQLLKLQSFAFIEAAITIKGYVGCPELCRAFSMTRQTASKLINQYMIKRPGQVSYCANAGRFLPAPDFALKELRQLGVSPDAFLSSVCVMSLHSLERIFVIKTGGKRQVEKGMTKLAHESDAKPRVMSAKYYIWNDQILSIRQISIKSGVDKYKLYPKLKNIKQHTDITQIVERMQ